MLSNKRAKPRHPQVGVISIDAGHSYLKFISDKLGDKINTTPKLRSETLTLPTEPFIMKRANAKKLHKITMSCIKMARGDPVKEWVKLGVYVADTCSILNKGYFYRDLEELLIYGLKPKALVEGINAEGMYEEDMWQMDEVQQLTTCTTICPPQPCPVPTIAMSTQIFL